MWCLMFLQLSSVLTLSEWIWDTWRKPNNLSPQPTPKPQFLVCKSHPSQGCFFFWSRSSSSLWVKSWVQFWGAIHPKACLAVVRAGLLQDRLLRLSLSSVTSSWLTASRTSACSHNAPGVCWALSQCCAMKISLRGCDSALAWLQAIWNR